MFDFGEDGGRPRVFVMLWVLLGSETKSVVECLISVRMAGAAGFRGVVFVCLGMKLEVALLISARMAGGLGVPRCRACLFV
jgi:hypothetical protein